MAKRKNYSQEYKLKAIELVVEQGQSPAAVARSLGISSGNLRRWIRQHQEQEAFVRWCERTAGAIPPPTRYLSNSHGQALATPNHENGEVMRLNQGCWQSLTMVDKFFSGINPELKLTRMNRSYPKLFPVSRR